MMKDDEIFNLATQAAASEAAGIQPNHIAVAWLMYMDSVVPKDAPPIQIQECKRAFFAGAWAAFQTSVSLPDDEDAAGRRLQWIQDELVEFKNRVGVSE